MCRLSDFKTGEIDAAAVMVQQGSREKPGMILGAAFVPLGARTTEVTRRHGRPSSTENDAAFRAVVCSDELPQIKRPANSRPLRELKTLRELNATELRYSKLWPGPSTPRGAGGLRNPECDPDRALRQRSLFRSPAWRVIGRNGAAL